MDNVKLQQFLYSCQKEALRLHFNNIDGIALYMNEKLENQTFQEAIFKQKQLLDRLGSGICFTMSSWVFDLLESMDAKNYFFMESHSSHWSNFVILFEVDGEYKICDLAAEVRKKENLIVSLMDAEPEQVLEIHKRLKNPTYLLLTPEEYIKEYPIEFCTVLQHDGNENTKYYDVPRINLKDFLTQAKEDNKNKKA